MMTLSISLTFVDPPHCPTLPPGVHSVAEVIPVVLASYGLSMPHDTNAKPTVAGSEVIMSVIFDVLEAALAS